ncbi:unnamed protein product [Acanthosepion pharaonis]|uniref:Uncharacterized protein n=1 Tax=Acanthosepion pharaonis TaxID=158019 RepID=A0A812DAC0_ACAPH|nr:unnamed protein product [Sepia pharaonis]
MQVAAFISFFSIFLLHLQSFPFLWSVAVICYHSSLLRPLPENFPGLFITFEPGLKLKQTFTFYSVYFLLHSILSSSNIFFPFSFYFFSLNFLFLLFSFLVLCPPTSSVFHSLFNFFVFLLLSCYLYHSLCLVLFFRHTPLSFFYSHRLYIYFSYSSSSFSSSIYVFRFHFIYFSSCFTFIPLTISLSFSLYLQTPHFKYISSVISSPFYFSFTCPL